MSYNVLILADNHKKDIFLFLILFVLSVISVYYFPPFLNKVFFLLLLTIAFASRKDYFWFTYFIIIVSGPMRLFEDYGGAVIHRIPEYNLIGNYGLTFIELLLIVFFIKAKIKGRKNNLILSKYYHLVFALIGFLVILSFLYGIEMSSFIGYARKFLIFTLFYSFPRLIREKDFIFMFKIFSVLTLLTFINQVLTASVGFNLADEIAGKHWVEFFFMDTQYLRAYDSVLSQFFTFIFGLTLYSMKKPPINPKFLLFIIGISFLSIFITGTRGWMVAFSVVVILYILFVKKRKAKVITNGIVALMLIFILASFFTPIQLLLRSNVERLSTLTSVIQGDLTAEGTISRLNVRLPKVVEGIKRNPILGWGFSETYAKYDDGHVGFANQVLQSGIIGTIVLVIFLAKFWLLNKNIEKRLPRNNNFKNSLLSLNLGMISLIIIHFTSTQIFGFSMHQIILTMVIVYFLLADVWQKLALREVTENTEKR